nr:DNA repair protein REV1-like [Oncorhynchus nerka]
MNGVQEFGGEDPCPVKTPRGVKDPTLTNGHTHPVNGAINPLDLSPNPTQHTPTPDRGLPHTLQSIPSQPDSPLSKPPIQHDTPRPPPVSHHRHHAQPANEQRPKPPPPTYQEAMAASASRPLDLPSQSNFPPEKPLPLANPNPSPSPVCLNGSHHNVFPSNPTPLETNSLSANPILSNYAPPHHDQQSAKVKTRGTISEFYSHSRLHHISTWRSEFSEYVNMLQSRMRATGGATFPGRDRLRRQRREGSNILLARMATRKAKPNGQYLLRSEEVDDFIRDQTVTSLPGVGRSMGGKLASLGVRSCGNLQQMSLQRLQKEFGPRTGQTLFRFCRGLDDRPVRSEKERKSVSAEMNYNIRFTQVDEAESFLTHLSIEVQKRLQGAGLRGRRLTLKFMVCKAGVEQSNYSGHGTCDNLARSVTLAQLTDCGHLIASEVIKLFHAMRLKVQDLRGVGLQVQLLEGAHSVPKDPTGPKTCYVRDKLLAQHPPAQHNYTDSPPNTAITDTCTSQENSSSARVLSPFSTPRPTSPAEPIPGTSKGEPPRTPNHVDNCLNLSIEVSPPSQVDRSVLEALPAELREQVEHSWTHRDTERTHNGSHQRPLHPGPSSPLSSCSSSLLPSSPPSPAAPPIGALVLQIPKQFGQTGSTGIILELSDFSQVDPELFAALPRELQEELRSVYGRRENTQGIMAGRPRDSVQVHPLP